MLNILIVSVTNICSVVVMLFYSLYVLLVIGMVAPGGTLEWAAPEQLLRKPVTPKTDVFSIGLMIIAVLSGSVYGRVDEHVVALRDLKEHTVKYKLQSVKLIEYPEVSHYIV